MNTSKSSYGYRQLNSVPGRKGVLEDSPYGIGAVRLRDLIEIRLADDSGPTRKWSCFLIRDGQVLATGHGSTQIAASRQAADIAGSPGQQT